MYSFEPTEEQRMLIDAINRYADSDLRAKAHDADEEAQLPVDLIEKGWELGYLQASLPEHYGGFGEHSAVTGVLAAEEMAWGDLAGALGVMTPNLFALPVFLGGTEEQKEEYLPQICSGNWIGAEAITEAGAGSDFLSLTTHADEEDGGYLINGTKMFISNGPICDFCITFAVTNPARKSMGRLSCFIIDRDTDGFEVGKPLEKMGLRTLQNSEMPR